MGYLAPKTLDDALALLKTPDIRLVAGGTDIFPAQGDRLPDGDLLDVTRIAEMRGIAEREQSLRIGAAVTWTEIAQASLPPAFLALKEAALEIGSLQIQNAATIGGNLCHASPAADGVPPLLILNADVVLASPKGIRRLPIQDFTTGPGTTALRQGEILIAVNIPRPPAHARSRSKKLGSRRYLVISIAMVAMMLRLDASGDIDVARVAVGACSPKARRLKGLELDLLGSRPGDRLVEARHLAELAPISDVRGTADYRLEAVAEQIRRLMIELTLDE